MLKAILVGNLGRDAEVKQVGDSKVIEFSVAHNERKRDPNTGDFVKETVWVRCSLWRREDQSTNVANYLTKGTAVYVEGDLKTRAYTDREGNQRASIDVRVRNLELIGGSSQGEDQEVASSTQTHPAQQSTQQSTAKQPPPQETQPASGNAGGTPPKSGEEEQEGEDDLPF